MTVQAEERKLYPIKWHHRDYGMGIFSPRDDLAAAWSVHDEGRQTNSLMSTKDAVDQFLKQPKDTLKLGLRLTSHTYLIPLNDFEKRNLPPYIIKLHKSPVWRESESKLIGELIFECEKRGVPLYVNTSTDIKKPWALLTTESTLVFLKTLSPLAPAN